MTAISAEDKTRCAFSYIKQPRSLIDHIFLSPNLTRTYGSKDYYIVARDRNFPGFVNDLSDHRPVVVRVSLGTERSRRPSGAVEPETVRELKEILKNGYSKAGPSDRRRSKLPVGATK